MSQTIKLEDVGRKLRLKKMQVAGYKANAARDGRVLVGFYKDKDGKTKPLTRSIREINRKKVVKHGKQFRGVNPSNVSKLRKRAKNLLPRKFVGYMRLKDPDKDMEVAYWANDKSKVERALIEEYHPDDDIQSFFHGMNGAAGIGTYAEELEHEGAVKGYAKVLTGKKGRPLVAGYRVKFFQTDTKEDLDVKQFRLSNDAKLWARYQKAYQDGVSSRISKVRGHAGEFEVISASQRKGIAAFFKGESWKNSLRQNPIKVIPKSHIKS